MAHGPTGYKGEICVGRLLGDLVPPCRAAIAELNEIHEKLANSVVVIGLSDESEETIKAFQAQAKRDEPGWVIHCFVAIDPQARMKRAVEVTGIPRVLLIEAARRGGNRVCVARPTGGEGKSD